MRAFAWIGGTPLFDLSDLLPGRGVRLLAKAEYLNPSGSVKDRAAAAMLRDGIEKGRLTGGKTIIDATSGNTGISYAMLGARLGLPVRIYLPRSASKERKQILRCYGARVIETSPLGGMEEAAMLVHEEVEAHPEAYFYPDQYSNAANWRAHYTGTGPEIYQQTTGEVTHFVAAAGTGGTFLGCVRYLRRMRRIRAVLVEPDAPFHGIEGILHSSGYPAEGFFRPEEADEVRAVTTEASYQMARRLTRELGLFVGVSSGANVRAALEVSREAPPGSVVVTILCDAGNRYLTGPLWEESDA